MKGQHDKFGNAMDTHFNLEQGYIVWIKIQQNDFNCVLPLKVPWHQKVLICNMMKNGVYSDKKLKYYMYYKYLGVKWLKLSNCAQIMLFVGL